MSAQKKNIKGVLSLMKIVLHLANLEQSEAILNDLKTPTGLNYPKQILRHLNTLMEHGIIERIKADKGKPHIYYLPFEHDVFARVCALFVFHDEYMKKFLSSLFVKDLFEEEQTLKELKTFLQIMDKHYSLFVKGITTDLEKEGITDYDLPEKPFDIHKVIMQGILHRLHKKGLIDVNLIPRFDNLKSRQESSLSSDE